MRDVPATGNQDTRKSALNRRLEDVGWGLLLLMTGGILLVPGDRLPPGTWLIGAGIVLLGLNWVRYRNGIRMKGLTTILGVLALAAGLGEFYGLQLPLLAIFLILVGASIILKPLLREEH